MKIDVFFQEFDQKFQKEIPKVIAEESTEYYQERFEEQSWDGVPWKALSPEYARKKTRGAGRILSRTTELQNSIRPKTVNPDRVTISAGNSKIPYAKVHNEGDRISGVQYVRPHTKKNFMGKNKSVTVKGHNRTIDFKMPKRQYMGFTRELQERIMNRLRRTFKRN